ncbi:bifunctional UDP-3-O-[3-hydroxymyristoyl] N-acetylglucosamine deacetylase/3-hydroxyacyl-ACP dehydratase [Cytophagaceae bacterium DM2B3-1]|uniref:Multifunctional fusion protein n=2 Tax=Xanthocytophaga TaxID=3078918 RepID=A0AAE3QRA3_9BACT|nr:MULTISPECIES: bifunctional UDP-3-O-[3-hydroxymyristoyl] N-acetylglucosamine deacetylase/3-hydroxyacyl-ACP dehydratase [Xanthocytophaga]MDJ1471221.1 bifunctional UDP-3-O-[3-hydroxymyristoyl] N-acetylglucosamine deacetylase/3-hydroxyacyl-ACP dehydratase [Xanthocytophaga flavus]MDJ1483456.1 bifunctional UDP-3-O-[3-hydroxymyristoyl] N-acetylglucosamine deacetylase/3-hydroxyacyl-ACP dehydratase [Xanthocytophaga flavus]MDJ1495780.1 bifunctional UDP-3-O-[3-hydroxymyristoyl] N-acetylglucosamine deace
MHLKQHTIKKAVTLSGVGLHTGVPANMTFLPAKPHHGYKFQRIDLEGQPIVDADVDNVVDLSRGTTIEQSGARINTVEHTLAALVGMEIDNVLIQLDGPEPPIMDGSSIQFVQALEFAEREEQNALRNFYEITEEIRYRDKERDVEIAALPLSDYRMTVMVDYNSPVLGSQHASLTDISQFSNEIANCRTFCFLHELEMLHKAGLVKGGDLNNAIVIVDRIIQDEELDYLAGLFNKPKVEVRKEGILNNVELRYKNEPARHKLLDLMGDLALAGRPLKAQILAARPGHAANVAFAKKIKKKMQESASSNIPVYDPKLPPVLDSLAISNILPHRYPFQLIDKIIHLDESSVTGVKNVTMNEPFFMGHFPGNPVMPGVLQIEAMAQTGGILVLSTVPDPENYWTYFLSIENCRFRKMVLPGDTIIFKCELMAPIKRGIAKMQGQAFVAGQVVCEAVMSASIVRKK